LGIIYRVSIEGAPNQDDADVVLAAILIIPLSDRTVLRLAWQILRTSETQVNMLTEPLTDRVDPKILGAEVFVENPDDFTNGVYHRGFTWFCVRPTCIVLISAIFDTYYTVDQTLTQVNSFCILRLFTIK
jgi:hypothetical protein